MILIFGVGRSVFMQPLRDARQDREIAERDLEDASADDMQLRVARKRLDDAKASSLPPSPNDAQRLYLEWVTDLTQACNFSLASVEPTGQSPRSGKYLLVSVLVEAEASLEDFSRFLFQFRQADLMHRITKLDVSSNTTTGKPRMEFSLTAEGMGIIGSEMKSELFPRTELTAPLDPESTQLTVNDAESFPSNPPFVIRVGFETVRVTGMSGKAWTVKRAEGSSEAQQHAESTLVRHFPVAWDRRDRQFEEYTLFLEQPPFTRPAVPREYNPQLAGLENVTIVPGETASITARVDEYDVDVGAVEFALEDDVPDGIGIDSDTGQLRWETAEDQQPQDYKMTVVATQQNNPELRLQQAVTITVKLPNRTPEISFPENAVVLLGQEFELTPDGTDDGGTENLTWTLEAENLPEGLAVDGTTGTLSWNPPLTFTPGSHTIQVTATDKGDPPQSASRSITLEAKDDDARYSRLTAIVLKDGRPEAWFENSRTNSQDILHVGDHLSVADIEAEILEIKARVVTFKDDQGVWQLALGNNTRARVLRSSSPEEDSL